jgi:hypothetical protein
VDATRHAVNQTGHGFVVGNLVRISSFGFYGFASAASAGAAEVAGMVGQVIDANNFVLVTNGWVSGLTGLTNGVYFLDATGSGTMSHTEPSTVGQVSKPVFIADSTTSGYFYNFRGQVIAAAATADPRLSRWRYYSVTPAVPNAQDDEFVGTLNPLWTPWGDNSSLGQWVVGGLETKEVNVIYTGSAAGAFRCGGLQQAAPLAPWRITVPTVFNGGTGYEQGIGLFARESSTGKMWIVGRGFLSGVGALGTYYIQYTGSGPYTSSGSGWIEYGCHYPLWLRLERTGTVINTYTSTDGINWTTLQFSIQLTGAFTVEPDQYGIFANSYTTSLPGAGTFGPFRVG